MKNISVLGSTGSIGRQTLEVAAANPEKLKIRVLAAHRNIDLMLRQIETFHPDLAVLTDKEAAAELQKQYHGKTEILSGQDGLLAAATHEKVDTVLGAMVGYAGLRPTLAAINAGKDIALANKETLVAAGHIVMQAVKENHVNLLPVDSEHSAIFQSLNGENRARLDKILLTASGGPFRGKTYEELNSMTVEQALKHPNWSMGKKVTIDSASLVNKGLEVIEAKWLFDVSPSDITVLIHPESIVHSMVQYTDGAVIAEMGIPDMKLPIQYALFYPDRRPMYDNRVDFFKLEKLTFYEPDIETFKGLKFAYDAIKKGGNAPTVFNAANEFAVKRFLDKKIGFTGIYDIIEAALSDVSFIKDPSFEEILATQKECDEFLEKRF